MEWIAIGLLYLMMQPSAWLFSLVFAAVGLRLQRPMWGLAGMLVVTIAYRFLTTGKPDSLAGLLWYAPPYLITYLITFGILRLILGNQTKRNADAQN